MRAQLKAIRAAGVRAPHDLGKIRQPVLVANGDHDLMVASAHSADMARRQPNAELVLYPDSGDILLNNQPARVASQPGGSPSRRRLQWTLAVLAAIPVASASGEIVRGPQGVPGGSPDVTPTVDSSLRYANAFKFAVGPVIWSQLTRVERSPAVTFALSTIFIGGLSRLWSWQQRGRPHPVTVSAIVLETLGPPVMIAWQRRVCSR